MTSTIHRATRQKKCSLLLGTVLLALVPGQGYAQFNNYSAVIENISDCVVSIVAMSSGEQEQGSQEQMSFNRGTGITLSDNGYIVTNNHIVADADRYFIELNNGFVFEGQLTGGDPATDIAVLKIEASELTTCELNSQNSAVQVGEIVLGIGSPYSLPGSVSVGVVSHLERALSVAGSNADFVLYIQTDLIINPGNSGGPVVNQGGDVIGMNTSTISSSAGSVGIAFAIPSSDIARVSRQLIRDGIAEKGDIGVSVTPLPQTVAQVQALGLAERRGALVGDVEIDSPAYNAGIRSGDVIVTVNREPIDSDHKFRYLIAAQEPGSSVRLSLIRNGSIFSTQVQVEGRNPANGN